MRPLGLGDLRAGERVVDGRGVPLREGLLHEDVDRDAVLGVHADERADLAGALHRAEDLPVVDEEHAGVGHEELEAT